jgi:hypothetical protein
VGVVEGMAIYMESEQLQEFRLKVVMLASVRAVSEVAARDALGLLVNSAITRTGTDAIFTAYRIVPVDEDGAQEKQHGT